MSSLDENLRLSLKKIVHYPDFTGNHIDEDYQVMRVEKGSYDCATL